MSLSFCHIAPTKYLDIFALGRKTHLVLAHLVESNDHYAEWYKKEKAERNSTIILDNSAFEMYKQGKPMYPAEKLVEMANKVNADYIVMPDYPNEDPEKTIRAAEEIYPTINQAGFQTFFCPQSKIGDVKGLVESYMWAVNTKWVDYIGFSILSIPNAYGVEKNNKLQRFLSRWKFLQELDKNNFFYYLHNNNSDAYNNSKKLHLLGMLDGPNEILLLEKYLPFFETWDSSAAVWYGINGISFDQSPTGMHSGKWETEVNFDHEHAKPSDIGIAFRNINYIDSLINNTLASLQPESQYSL
jgi:hypothetical protein